MLELILFVGFLAFVVWLFRFLRKREIEAFMEADLSLFQDFAAGREDVKAVPVTEKTVALATNVVSLRARQAPVQPSTRFVARSGVFDEIHRNFLDVLDKVLDDRFRVFVHTPLSDFLRVESGSADLRNRSVSFLVCDKSHLHVACGIMLQGASPSEMDHFKFLEQAFQQIDKPLISFPMLGAYSQREVREKVNGALKNALLSRVCPKCGDEMTMRKVVKGTNTGKTFWVCRQFPKCRSVMRLGRW